jgi:murein DD-endopeptidase MepM/ murein hydrolase activator NlpD
MKTASTYQVRSARHCILLLIVAATALALGPNGTRSTATAAPGGPSSYGWPVKPFDRQHPIRGYFGDPRTIFRAPPTPRGVLSGDGSFGFHQGVDISAPNGTPVYPVRSGVVSSVSHEWVRVASDGTTFEYWHIGPQVRVGQTVEARVTVLGRVLKPAEHVHLTEIEGGRAVNPLVPGRLTPYRDTTRPHVRSITLRKTATGGELFPSFVRGRIHFVVDAVDTPAVRVPGNWADLPVTPVRITWHIARWNGKVAVREHVARDVTAGLPSNGAFWRTYARGTYQNMAVFRPHYSFLQQGAYLFRLTPTAFDTRKLRDSVYDLVVTATDTFGNRDSLSLRFTVHNRPGWIGS